MSFAIQLFFDPVSEATIQNHWETLTNSGIPFPLSDSGNRPHFSLAIYDEIDVPVCTSLLSSFAQTHSPFPISIASLGIFHAEQTVVFLAPHASSHLLELHRQIHLLLQDATVSPAAYYLPGQWTPHCTLATRVPPHLLSQTIEIGLTISLPLPLIIEEIGIIQYPPVKHLRSFQLTGK